MITNCCSASFVDESDLCSECGEQAEELEEEACCESYQNGFKCTCIKSSYAYSQQAEDAGIADDNNDGDRDFLDDMMDNC